MTSSTLGQRIAAKRNELGLSQSALGEQLGVSRQSVFKWESDAAIPEIDKLIALSRLFGVSLDWLMGIGERAHAKEEPTQDFTDRERQILEQFSQQKPAVPQWQKWLTVAAAVCAAASLAVACFAFSKWSSTQRQLEQVQAQAEEYIQYIQNQILPQVDVISDVTSECVPTLNLDKAEARFRITPSFYHPDSSALVLVMLGTEAMGTYDCTWNGEFWETEFELGPANGYQFLFRLTDEIGKEFTQELNGGVMENLAYNLAWPMNYSVTWKDLDIQDGSFTFTDMTVDIPLPGVFRDSEGLWEQCDLVLTDDAGNELNRVDLMNRSNYSAEIDFSGSDICFTTRHLEMFFPGPDMGRSLSLSVDCILSTGQVFVCPVETWQMTANGLTANYNEARE